MAKNPRPSAGRRFGAEFSCADVTRREPKPRDNASDRENLVSLKAKEIKTRIKTVLAAKDSETKQKVQAAQEKWQPHIDALEVMKTEDTLPTGWGDAPKSVASYLNVLFLHLIETGTSSLRGLTTAQKDSICTKTLGLQNFGDVPLTAKVALKNLVLIDLGAPLRPNQKLLTRVSSTSTAGHT